MRLNSKELKKHFYSIPDLAAKWDCDEKDIIHLAISREIFLSVNLTQYSLPNMSGWWNIWNPAEIATLLTGEDIFLVSFFHNPADDDNPEKFTTLRRYEDGDGMRRAFEFLRTEVVVRGRYVERFELNHPEKFLNNPPAELHQPNFHEKPLAPTPPVDAPPTTAPPAAGHQAGQKDARKGGRPPSQLYLGIEALYLKKLTAGETVLLQPQAGKAFLEELRRAVNGPEVCENVKIYIPKLERRGGRYRVYVADPPEIDGRTPKNNENPKGYTAADVSKIMHRLRKKYPLE